MDLNDKKIMLVDDDAICNLISKKTLERMGIDTEITVALNGAEAMDILNESAQQSDSYPDIIFLDLNMPVMDGFEFLDAFNNSSKIPKESIDIVVVTSSEDPTDIRKIQERGIKHFITKPLSESKLLHAFD